MVGWEKVTLPKQYRGLGVRVARAANTVWLGKLVWDMHRKPTKLWVSVLPHKYLKNEQFLDSHHRNDSPIWTSISKTKNILREGYHFRIGDRSSLFWYAPWVPNGPLFNHVFTVDIHDVGTRIKYVYQNSTWQLDRLYTDMPLQLKNQITTT